MASSQIYITTGTEGKTWESLASAAYGDVRPGTPEYQRLFVDRRGLLTVFEQFKANNRATMESAGADWFGNIPAGVRLMVKDLEYVQDGDAVSKYAKWGAIGGGVLLVAWWLRR